MIPSHDVKDWRTHMYSWRKETSHRAKHTGSRIEIAIIMDEETKLVANGSQSKPNKTTTNTCREIYSVGFDSLRWEKPPTIFSERQEPILLEYQTLMLRRTSLSEAKARTCSGSSRTDIIRRHRHTMPPAQVILRVSSLAASSFGFVLNKR